MRYLIVLTLLSFQLCNAQENPLLRIVAYHGDVSIDENSVHSGQLVFSPDQKLVVAKNSYAYVLTPKGYAMKLDGGSYKIKDVEEIIVAERYTVRRKTPGSAIVCKIPYPIVFSGLDEYAATIPLLGDSIYLQWKPNPQSGAGKKVKPPFDLTFVSLFEDVLYKAEINELFLEADLKRIAGSDMNVLMRMNKNDSQHYLIKFLSGETAAPILNDIKEIEAGSIPKYFLDLVVYDCNNLILDQMFTLHKTARLDTSVLPDDLKNYLSLQKTKYEL